MSARHLDLRASNIVRGGRGGGTNFFRATAQRSSVFFANAGMNSFLIYEKIYCRAGHLSKLRTATVLNSGFTERPGCTINTFSCVAGRTLGSGTGGEGGGTRRPRPESPTSATKGIFNLYPSYKGDLQLPPPLPRGFTVATPIATQLPHNCHPRYQGDLQLPPLKKYRIYLLLNGVYSLFFKGWQL